MLGPFYGSVTRLATGKYQWSASQLTLNDDTKQRAMQETAWADGLRGIAALYVVSSHVVLSYATSLVNPCCADGSDAPSLFQRPIFRLVASGHSWVAIFLILMGFVNALKPLSLARSGQADMASSKLATSAFSRIFRLMLPAAFATLFSWMVCQMGFYEMGRNSDAFWLAHNSPQPSVNIFVALADLKTALFDTWVLGVDNQYDQPQWALIYFLQGSLMIILTLLMTVNMTPVWRTISLVFMAFASIDWSYHIGDPWTGMTCFLGIVLAEFSISNLPSKLAPLSVILSPPIAIFALVLMSFPGNNPKGAPWSAYLEQFGDTHFGEHALERLYGSFGGILLVASIVISPHTRWALSQKPLKWLGKVSFAIYLLHGTFMRTIFAWVLFLGSEKREFQLKVENGLEWPNETFISVWKYPLPGTFRCIFATVALLASTLFASQVWNMKVEPICAKMTGLAEKLVKGQLSGDEVLGSLGHVQTEQESLPRTRKD